MEPWEMDWGKIAEDKLGTAQAVSDDSGKEPWEIDWGAKAKDLAKKSPKDMDMTGITYDSIVPKPKPVAKQTAPKTSFEDVFGRLIKAESRGVHAASDGSLTTSGKGAQGITQLMPKTAANPGFGIKPVQDNSEGEYLRVGKEYLNALYNKYKDWPLALAAYNAGIGNVEKARGKAERFGGDWRDHLPKPSETLPYINKILGTGK